MSLEKNRKRILNDSEITTKAVKWLFFPYIPRGEVTILNSDPGSGKTYLSCWISAQISNGNTFPINPDQNSRGSFKVAYLSKEDKYDTTIIPRYRACGGKEGNLLFLTLEDMPEDFSDPVIDELINQKVDLIIFDAVSSFIGSANMNQSNEVRKALMPLYEKIAGTDTAILLIAHNNKMATVTNPQYRISGSVDFAAFVRSGLTIAKKDDEFILAQYKNNFFPNGRSLSFKLSSEDSGKIPGLNFSGISPLTAEALTGAPEKVKKQSVVDEIAQLLYLRLKDLGGFAKTREIQEELFLLGYKKSSIERARKVIGVRAETKYDHKSGKTVGYLILPGIHLPAEESQSSFIV